MQHIKHYLKNIDKNMALVAIAVVGVIIVGSLIYLNSNPGFSLNGILGMSNKKLADKAISYINDNKLSQTPATLVGDITEESGLVKFQIQIGSSKYDTYETKDGKLFFPQVINMDKAKDTAANNNSNQPSDAQKQQAAASITKTDAPVLDAYIVARCPFGLQMQRAMNSAITELPALAKYLKVRYIGNVASSGKTISSMHGDAEGVENLRQICIREEQPTKYWPYVACQMKAGDTAGCEKSTGVDSAKLSACTSDTSRGITYAKADFALDTKYNVNGSPTLMIGDAVVSENGFGGRSADGVKSMVCAGFKTQPDFCKTKLTTAEATTSFSSSTTTGSGNSGSNGANCAPAQ